MKKNPLDQAFFDRNIPAPSEDFAWNTMAKLRTAAAREQAEHSPRRRLSMGLALAMGLAMLAAVALAASLLFSPKFDAAKEARQTLMLHYGLTQDTLGLFGESVAEENGGWLVRYAPLMFDENAMGAYEVRVKAGQAPEAAWSNDGKTVLPYDTAGYTGEAWGQSQLQHLLAVFRSGQAAQNSLNWDEADTWTLEDKAKRFEAYAEAAKKGLQVEVMYVAPTESDIQPEAAVELARQAIVQKYGVTPESLAELQTDMELIKYGDEEEPLYRINFGTPEKKPGVYTFHSKYFVTLFTPSGKVERCDVWATDPERYALPEGPLDAYHDAVKDYVAGDGFALLPPKEKADLGTRIAEAGFSDLLEGKTYVAPQDGDLPESAALAAVGRAMRESGGFTTETLALFKPRLSMQMTDSGRTWVAEYVPDNDWDRPEDGWWPDLPHLLGHYQVTLAASTGTMKDLTWDLQAQRGTESYTESTWGAAPAYDAAMLPWVQKLMGAYAPYAVKERTEGKTGGLLGLEDQAASDQLFRDAGFPANQYGSCLPGPGDLPQAKALELAKQAVSGEYGLTEAQLQKAEIIPSFRLATEEQKPAWCFMFFFGGQEPYDYFAMLDAESGAILTVIQEGMGNG